MGAYEATGSNGGFSLTGDYSCASGQQLYLYVLGGSNSAAGLLAAIGACPISSSPAISVTVNEVTTIAAAYSMAGFAVDATHVSSSGTALAQVGVANAFTNASNLASLSTGAALSTTPAGNGTVPQATINTLADILAACVNSSTTNACSTLFSNAKSGGSTGATATDTATAAINVAHNPGTNVAQLYALSTSGPAFAGGLTAQPNDFTVGLIFTGGGLDQPFSIAIDGSGYAWTANPRNNSVSKFSSVGAALSPSSGYTGGGLDNPFVIAIDGSGDAWAVNEVSVSQFSSAGAALSPSTGYTGGGLSDPQGLAIDGSGDVWIANYKNNGVSKFSNAGAALSPSAGFTGGGLSAAASRLGLNGSTSIAIDGSGNAWISNAAGNNSVSKFSSAGVALSPSTGYTGGGLSAPQGLAIDNSGDVWIANIAFSSVSKFSSSGSALSPSTGYTGGGTGVLDSPYSTAIDGSGDVWTANLGNNSVSNFSSAGAALSPPNGYTGGGLPSSIAIDGSGDVWVTNEGGGSIVELIGAATPVITPICAGLPATPTADGSSNLGTRP